MNDFERYKEDNPGLREDTYEIMLDPRAIAKMQILQIIEEGDHGLIRPEELMHEMALRHGMPSNLVHEAKEEFDDMIDTIASTGESGRMIAELVREDYPMMRAECIGKIAAQKFYDDLVFNLKAKKL